MKRIIRATIFLGACLASASAAHAQAEDPLRDPAVRKVRDAFRVDTLALLDIPLPGPVRGAACTANQSTGFSWCTTGVGYEASNAGAFSKQLGYHLDPRGRIVHIVYSRREFPLERGKFDEFLKAAGARYGGVPVTFTFTGKTSDGDEVQSLIAVWGPLKLVRLNDAELRAVAAGGAVGRGPLVDHRQDPRASAQQRDPVFKIEGTAGYVVQLRSVTDVRTDIVQRVVYPAGFADPAPGTVETREPPQPRAYLLDPKLALLAEKARLEAERLAAIERARREEEARKAAEARRIEEERKAAEEKARREEEERQAAIERARREEEERKAAEARRVEEARRAVEEKARREEEERKAAAERARRAEAERKAAEERARIEAERKAAEERRIAEERARAEAERKAAEERARIEAERKAAEERRIAEERARAEAERKAAEERARLEAERKAAEERRIAEERARAEAERKAAEERRAMEERARRAEAEYKAAAERARRAEADRLAAEERVRQAEAERKVAEDRAKRIETERKAAEERARREEEERKAAEDRAKRIAEERVRAEAERKAADERSRSAAEEKRQEEARRLAAERARIEELERRAAAERARIEELERRAAAERAGREESQRKSAAAQAEAERRAAEERARRAEAERADADRRRAEAERQAENARRAEERAATPPRTAEKPAAERPVPERKVAGVPDQNKTDATPGAAREAWLRMAASKAKSGTAHWVFNRARDRISDDLLLQAQAVFTGERLAVEIAFECNIDAGKRLKAFVRAFDARSKASLRIPPEDGQASVVRGSVTLDEDAPQTAFIFPERDERQASIVEVPVTHEDVRRNTPRAQVWLRHYQVAIKLRLPQGDATATIYPYDDNLRRVLDGCAP